MIFCEVGILVDDDDLTKRFTTFVKTRDRSVVFMNQCKTVMRDAHQGF